jgi:peroxiredoxin
MSLADKIQSLQEEMIPNIPPDALAVILQKTEELVASGLSNQSLKVGDLAPIFSLPDDKDMVQKSETLLSNGPLIISFYRGGWCPYCNLELRALQRIWPEIRSHGASLVAIAPERPEKVQESVQSKALEFPVLSDRGNSVAKEFGLVFSLDKDLRPIYAAFGFDIPNYNGDQSYELPMPATYIVGVDGRIIWSFVDEDYTKRAEPEDILQVLKSIHS